MFKDSSGINVIGNFDRVDNHIVIFDARITNKSNSDILVDPHMFSCEFATIYSDTTRVYAVSPEEVILTIDKIKSDTRKSRSSTNCIETGFCLLGALNDIYGEEKTAAEEIRDAEYRRSREENERRRQEEYEKKIEKLDERREFFSNSVLRKTTLRSGDTINGKIMFPMPKDTRQIVLHIKIDNFDFRFDLTRVEKNFRIENVRNVQYD